MKPAAAADAVAAVADAPPPAQVKLPVNETSSTAAHLEFKVISSTWPLRILPPLLINALKKRVGKNSRPILAWQRSIRAAGSLAFFTLSALLAAIHLAEDVTARSTRPLPPPQKTD